MNFFKSICIPKKHDTKISELIKYIGPGLLVTVGFIDPGNWASNVYAGASYGYTLLWVVTLSTIMLIFLQHNAAHLGIITGKCIAEAVNEHFNPLVARTVLGSSILAAVSTSFAEILGGAIALNMLFRIPIQLGAIMVFAVVIIMIFSNSYKKLEKWIMAFVSLIGVSFLIEIFFVNMDFGKTAVSLVVPSIPSGAMPIVMGILGAVVMPHNLFLHSEFIQSRQWNLEDETTKKRLLKYEFMDTVLSMCIGWAINAAMIIVAAATFFSRGIHIEQLEQAQSMLTPILGNGAGIIFAIALLLAGLASSTTAGMAGGSIFAGMYSEAYSMEDSHTKIGIAITLSIALIVVFFVKDTLSALVWSQILLSIQLPITVVSQLWLTSNKKVMGEYANKGFERIMLYIIAVVIIVLNISLLMQLH